MSFVPGRFLNGRMSSGVAELAGIAEAARYCKTYAKAVAKIANYSRSVQTFDFQSRFLRSRHLLAGPFYCKFFKLFASLRAFFRDLTSASPVLARLSLSLTSPFFISACLMAGRNSCLVFLHNLICICQQYSEQTLLSAPSRALMRGLSLWRRRLLQAVKVDLIICPYIIVARRCLVPLQPFRTSPSIVAFFLIADSISWAAFFMSDFYFIPSLSHSQYQFIFYNPVYHQYFKPRNAGKQTPLNSNSIPIMSLPSDGTTIWTLDIIINIIYRATMILIGIGIIWKNSREAIRTIDGMVFKYTNQMSRFLTKLIQKSNS